MKNAYCSHCGTKFENLDWPRVCPNTPECGVETWENPTSVAVVLQPVIGLRDGQTRYGAIVGKRAIEPQRGHWSLISGYIGIGETAEDAARREFREETSLHLKGEPRYAYSIPNARGLLILCFVASQVMTEDEFLTGTPCAENEALGVRWIGDTSDLAFPLQSEFFERWADDRL